MNVGIYDEDLKLVRQFKVPDDHHVIYLTEDLPPTLRVLSPGHLLIAGDKKTSRALGAKLSRSSLSPHI